MIELRKQSKSKYYKKSHMRILLKLVNDRMVGVESNSTKSDLLNTPKLSSFDRRLRVAKTSIFD